MKDLKKQFEEELFALAERTYAETNYNPKRFKNLIKEHGGVGTAKNLLGSNKQEEGYIKLLQLGRLDLTMEYFIVNTPQYHSLFTEKELKKALQLCPNEDK
ncbi:MULTISPECIES: hypothetical protein [unclassified Bartonella]|uniref:hypothetical protein n=1 Tax=unclassified Bartonella TaxID=2645622 RepID=UPI0015FBECA6|nr:MULTISPECIES: hypothetical protein [unclassified Bartonella]UXN03477.1 hypothetical protein N6B01_13750 [Bartonella sp. HY406]UXN06446.1 hypothetical protein N6A79_14535 [Bartonella sp. HY761]